MPIPFAIPECRIGSCVEQRPNHLTVEVYVDGEVGRCPKCGQTSRSVHSRYHRHPADLPISTSRTTLNIEVRRFYCSNPCCPRRTFAEPASELVAPSARRTRRLAETQGRVGIVCGGAPGARLLTDLYMPASRATVLRLVRAMPMPDAPAPTHVGVDDWAMRKGCSYGTIVVDLDRHRVVDLLPDRTAATLAGWLTQRPDIRFVARDRSTEYARGAGLGAPQAAQVADRWHLLANMRQAVERWLHGAHAGLRRLPPIMASSAASSASISSGSARLGSVTAKLHARTMQRLASFAHGQPAAVACRSVTSDTAPGWPRSATQMATVRRTTTSTPSSGSVIGGASEAHLLVAVGQRRHGVGFNAEELPDEIFDMMVRSVHGLAHGHFPCLFFPCGVDPYPDHFD